MSNSRLFKTKSSKSFFGTQRFDFNENGRLHMISAAALLHDNYRLSNLDYGHLMDAAFKLMHKFDVYEHFLRLALFNVLSHNRDDHSKNFSFLMNSKGEWQIAPAYDLTFSTSTHGYHSSTIAGEGKNPSTSDFERLSKTFNVKSLNTLISDVSAVTQNWTKYAKAAGVSKQSTKLINDTLKRTYSIFIS
jgi:serine/threonine-protein kinase HipA